MCDTNLSGDLVVLFYASIGINKTFFAAPLMVHSYVDKRFFIMSAFTLHLAMI